MEIRTFAVCRTCSQIYPPHRRCPDCDGDADAAAEVEEARKAVADDIDHTWRLRYARRNWAARSILALSSLSLILGSVALLLDKL